MMSGSVRRAGSLSLREWFDLVVLLAVAVLIELGIRSVRLPRLAGWLGVRLHGEPTAASGWRATAKQRRRRRIIEMLARHWPVRDAESWCLRRSLLLGWVLRDRSPLLRIGVARRDGDVTAHAWLELEGGQIGADGVHQPLRFPMAGPG